jgi:hypothetical protein
MHDSLKKNTHTHTRPFREGIFIYLFIFIIIIIICLSENEWNIMRKMLKQNADKKRSNQFI